MMPDKFNVRDPLTLTILGVGLSTLVGSFFGIIATFGSTNDISLPSKTATRTLTYIFYLLALLAHLILLFLLLPHYVNANKPGKCNSLGNDLEYRCVYWDGPCGTGVPCTAGHKQYPYELFPDWRFLMLFWLVFGLIIIQTIIVFLVNFASRKPGRSVTIGAPIGRGKIPPTTKETTVVPSKSQAMSGTYAEVSIETPPEVKKNQ